MGLKKLAANLVYCARPVNFLFMKLFVFLLVVSPMMVNNDRNIFDTCITCIEADYFPKAEAFLCIFYLYEALNSEGINRF